MLETSSTVPTNMLGISYIEWNNNRVKTNADISTAGNSIASRSTTTFEVGMPPRNLTLQSLGDQAQYGG